MWPNQCNKPCTSATSLLYAFLITPSHHTTEYTHMHYPLKHKEKKNLQRSQEEDGKEDKSTGDKASKGGLDTALELDSRARE